MAEIHVQAKKKTTPVWIWIVVGVLVLAAIAYFLMRNKKTDQGNTVNKPVTTSFIQNQTGNELLFYV
jgi:hypothetical protein